tara:strand:+ start:258 stop:527 length:270 start_codon:yes stop_codon:yes gene_type:complete
MKKEDSLRKFIREEIGRNFHTLDNSPHTFDDFQDYDIEINGDPEGVYFLTIHYKDEKIFPTQKFNSREDAFSHSRQVIDNDRVKRMNQT